MLCVLGNTPSVQLHVFLGNRNGSCRMVQVGMVPEGAGCHIPTPKHLWHQGQAAQNAPGGDTGQQNIPGQKIQSLKPTLKAKPPAPVSIYFLLAMQEEKSHPISSIHSSDSPKFKQLPVGSPRQSLELNLSLVLSKAWEMIAQSNKSTQGAGWQCD